MDGLLESMKRGLDLKDPRISQIVTAFEKREAEFKIREHELERMLAEKNKQLTAQRTNGNGSLLHHNGSSSTVRELEKSVAEREAEIVALESEKSDLIEREKRMQQALDSERNVHVARQQVLEREKIALEQENEKERELHTVLRRRFDEMTAKFDL